MATFVVPDGYTAVATYTGTVHHLVEGVMKQFTAQRALCGRIASYPWEWISNLQTPLHGKRLVGELPRCKRCANLVLEREAST